MALYSPLKMTCTIARVGSFNDKEVFDLGGALEDKLLAGRGYQNALLHHTQFNL
jgi:hypothetical protein